MVTGTVDQMPKAKDPREMASADEILDAVLEWALYYGKKQLIEYNFSKEISTRIHPDPANSLLLDESLDEGIEAQKLNLTRWSWPNFLFIGRQNLADSLAAVQKLVFDEKKYTMENLLSALKANWAGHEEMRQDFLNAPKYGNDDDFADEWCRKVNVRMEGKLNQLKDAYGFNCTIDSSVVILYQMAGQICGASPDGRLASEHLADGSTSPMAGADKSGPTAVLNSAGKTPYMHTGLFNQRFQPMWMEGENKSLFRAYLREWYEKGTIPHVQFNVVDGAVLRNAQEHPEEHTDLQVRVAGYSAFFVDLPHELQESIIARSEQSF